MAIEKRKIENLKPGKKYALNVKVKNTDLNIVSDLSDTIIFTVPTDTTIPSALTNLELFAGLENVMFVFDYSEDLDIRKYEYELYQNSDMSDETGPRTGFADANIFTVSVDNLQLEEDGGGLARFWGRARAIDTTGNAGPWTSLVETDDRIPVIDNQYIGSLTASKITAGTISSHTITLNSASSIIKSSNFDGEAVGDGSYSNATTGWLINGQGKAYFYDATVVGSIDIGGFDSGSFHVNTSGDMWLGAGTYGAAPFRVSRDGVLEIGAGTGSRIGGQLIDAIAETVIDFNGRNNRNSTAVTAPTLPSPVTVGNLVIGASYTIVSVGTTSFTSIGAANNTVGTVFTATGVGAGTGTVSGETIDHTLNTDGSVNISFEWSYTYSSADNAANNIDGFYVHMYSSTSSDPYTFGTTPNLEATYPVDYLQRALIFSGLPADKYYTFGVKAFRVVDKDVATPGVIYSSMVKSSVTGENPYRPSANVNYTGNIDGTLSSTIVSYANAGNTVAINFNANNDRNSTTPTSPVIVSNGTAIDHTINTDGSADISFEWTYTVSDVYNAATNIDGFIVYVRSTAISGATPSSYTFGASPDEETTYYLPREKRAFILPGVAANRNYNFAVRAYRMVDTDIAAAGIIYSPIVQSSYGGELFYQPSTTVAFAGDITGTVNSVAVATITTGISNFNSNNDRKSTTPATPTSVAFSAATSNTNASIDLPLNWTYTNSSISISSASYVSLYGTTNYNTSTPHGFTTGNTVTIAGITPSSFNRTATVTVVNSTQFFFSLFNGSTGGAYSSGGSATNEANAYDIDGFVVFLRTSTATDTTSITTSDLDTNIQQIYLTAEKRSHTFSGISPSSFHKAAVRAYRVVDTDINSAGIIYGPLVNTTERSSAIAIIGGSSGIKIGNGTIYIGTDPGTFNNANTGFYVDSAGQFSLKDKLTWNGTDTLSVTGTINATSGTFNNTITVGTNATKINIVGTSATTTTAIYSSGTGYGTGSGFWMDASGRFSLGTNLTWNGTSTLTITGAISGGTIDIGGADTTSFHVDSTGKMWSGAALYDDAKFKVSAGGAIDATSGSIAGWTIGVPEVTAGFFIIGQQYKIVSSGNTSFTSIGAANNNVNTVFTATGVGSGTGIAKPNDGVNTLTNGSGASLSILSPQGWAWFSSGIITTSISGYGGPTTTGGATSQNTTTVSSGTRGYLRNISHGSTKPNSPVLGDIHFTT